MRTFLFVLIGGFFVVVPNEIAAYFIIENFAWNYAAF